MLVTQDCPQPVEQVLEHVADHQNLAPVFGAKLRQLNEGTGGSRNGPGSAREMRVRPLPPFVERTDGGVPGIAPIVKAKLTRDVLRAMRKLAATGSA